MSLKKLKSKIAIWSPDGVMRSSLDALVTPNMVLIDDPRVVVKQGDEIRRALPNGQEDIWEVVDPVFYERGVGSIGAHYQVTVRRKVIDQARDKYKIHVSGQNSRVNILSHDNSINYASSEHTVFNDLRAAIDRDVTIQEDNTKLKAAVLEMEKNKDGSGFGAAYQKFIVAAGDHMKVIGPFIPLLAQFFQPS